MIPDLGIQLVGYLMIHTSLTMEESLDSETSRDEWVADAIRKPPVGDINPGNPSF